MADNKSCEEKYIASSEALEVRSEILKRNLEYCFPLTPKQVDTVIHLYKDYKKRIDKKKSVGTIAVDIDCSDALTGLKSIQREAKKATAALKELEGVRTDMCVIDEMHLLDRENIEEYERRAWLNPIRL